MKRVTNPNPVQVAGTADVAQTGELQLDPSRDQALVQGHKPISLRQTVVSDALIVTAIKEQAVQDRSSPPNKSAL